MLHPAHNPLPSASTQHSPLPPSLAILAENAKHAVAPLTGQQKAVDVLAVVAERHALLAQSKRVLSSADSIELLKVRLGDAAAREVDVDGVCGLGNHEGRTPSAGERTNTPEGNAYGYQRWKGGRRGRGRRWGTWRRRWRWFRWTTF